MSSPISYERATVPMVSTCDSRLLDRHKDSRCAGRNKLVINHLGRLFVTSDAATIIREIEVVHPAAKLVVMASQAQEAEVSFGRVNFNRC
jgi:hypothetical protein